MIAYIEGMAAAVVVLAVAELAQSAAVADQAAAAGGPGLADVRIERRGYQGAVNMITGRTPGSAIKVDLPAGRADHRGDQV